MATAAVNATIPESSSGSTTVLATVIVIGLLVIVFSLVAAICYVCARHRCLDREGYWPTARLATPPGWRQEGFETSNFSLSRVPRPVRNNNAIEESINRWSMSAASGASSELSSASSLYPELDDVVINGLGSHSPPILHDQANINLHSSLPCITEVCKSHSASNTSSKSSLGISNLFETKSSATSDQATLTLPLTRKHPLHKPGKDSTTMQNLGTEHHIHCQPSELHSDYYSDYHSRLHSEHHSSRYGAGTRIDRSDYYSEDHSGRHSPHHDRHKHHRSSNSNPLKVSSEHPTIAPMIGFSSQNLYNNEPLDVEEKEEVVDSIILEAITSHLMHQDSCSIPRCPCAKIKKQFPHLMPQAQQKMQRGKQIDQQYGQRRKFQPRERHTHQSSTSQLPTGSCAKQHTSAASVSFEQEKPVLQLCEKPHSQATELPKCMTPTSTLFRCSSKRMKFIDNANDFSLEIPDGAIPEGKALTVDIGVALQGPFQFPEGLRPVSPIFWVCVLDLPNFEFSKPVTVTIPHFLNMKNYSDIQSLNLTFLKADHKTNSEQMYEFHHTDGTMVFEPLKKCGVFQTTHFCSLCIACQDIPECLEKTSFCINAVLPSAAIPVGKKVYGYFFITFLNLQTCLVKVDELVAKLMSKTLSYERDMQPFEFQINTQRDPALEIAITQSKQGKIGLKGNRRILQSQVDFFIRKNTSEKELQSQECRDLYPPRFQVFFSCSQNNATLSDAKIAFIGATNDPEFDIFLEVPDHEIPNTPANSQMLTVDESHLLDINDLYKVKSRLIGVASRWKDIGLALGLKNSQLDSIQSDNRTTEESLTAVIVDWLNKAYDTEEYGEPTWQKLTEAIRNPAGGNNPALANTLPPAATVTQTLC